MKSILLFLSLTLTCAAAPVTELKVLSFNIWVQGGLSLSNCIEVIRTSGADIVGLQECNATTAQTIATRLGFYVQPDPSYSIVSRYPILGQIPASGGRGATILLSPSQRVHFFDTHLPAYPYGPYDLKAGRTREFILAQEQQTRLPALTNVLMAMQPYIAGNEPCFLVGDFNAPSHLDYADFPWPTSVACADAGLTDSYRQLHSGNRTFPGSFAFTDPGITWTPRTSEESQGVFDRIDFVHYSLGDGAAAVASMELDERNSIRPWPSDHRAVLTRFTLQPPTLGAQASAPLPENGRSGLTPNLTLSWLPASNALGHVVVVGTQASTTSNTFLSLSNLTAGTTYSWRVDTITASGTVTGATWNFTVGRTNLTAFEWNFRKGDLTPSLGVGQIEYAGSAATLTTFGKTDGPNPPAIHGQTTYFLRSPAFKAPKNGYQVTLPGTEPNGGGAYINQYTLMYDLLLPDSLGWLPLFNTNPDNANDADFYVTPAGALGTGAIGYSAAGLIVPNKWYRIAFAADLAAGVVRYYLNGQLVFTGSAGLDGRHSLYSAADPGPDLFLFNESNGVNTHAVLLSAFSFIARTLSSAELLALGSPRASGIWTPAVPLRASITRTQAALELQWTGGDAPYQVQKAAEADASSWENLGPTLESTNLPLGDEGQRAFFRVVGR